MLVVVRVFNVCQTQRNQISRCKYDQGKFFWMINLCRAIPFLVRRDRAPPRHRCWRSTLGSSDGSARLALSARVSAPPTVSQGGWGGLVRWTEPRPNRAERPETTNVERQQRRRGGARSHRTRNGIALLHDSKHVDLI